jgi:predicted RNA-binding Zn-ribbon protein involved in translation (DUF1610 family)
MRKHKANKVMALFSVNRNHGKPNHFLTAYRCPKCGKVYKETLTKSKVLDLLRKDYMCNECLQREREEIRRRALEETMSFQTNQFIAQYLLGREDLSHDETLEQAFESMSSYGYRDNETIAAILRDMDYRDFLNTRYWKAIAAHKKKEAGWRCMLCGGEGPLSVHHRDYSHHGYEHAFMNDLVCLCSKCHDKFHDIIKGNADATAGPNGEEP